jgi:hypothetical protein
MDPGQAFVDNIRGWRRCVRATGLILRGNTWRVALPIALVVGTALVLVNLGAELASGDADTGTVLRLVANYAIPYLVSSIGYLSASTRDAPPADPTDGREEPLHGERR